MREQQIKIEPFSFIELNKVTIEKAVNEHTVAGIYGIVDGEKLEDIRQLLLSDRIRVTIDAATEGEEKIRLFCGMVKNYEIEHKNSVNYLTLHLIDECYLMDLEPHTRVFQQNDKTYEDIFRIITEGYPSSGIITGAETEKKAPELFVQYHETDWEFAKRLAARCNSCLVPDTLTKGTRYFARLPERERIILPEQTEYTIKKGDNTSIT